MSVAVEDIARALASRRPGRIAEAVGARAAVAAILRPTASGLEMLFIRRAEHERDPWSGQVGFPGGRWEPADRDLRATAVRETLEEIGVDLDESGELLGPLDEVRAMARGRPVDLAISPFVFKLREPVDFRLNPEVTSTHWLPLDKVLGPADPASFEYQKDDQTVWLPCLRTGGLVIWGLTFRMVAGLRKRLDASVEEPWSASSASRSTSRP
jgi:8-oxo-dGTP pyrophosphatase MutT (NUDIX family)